MQWKNTYDKVSDTETVNVDIAPCVVGVDPSMDVALLVGSSVSR
jgi:hypothetical protein